MSLPSNRHPSDELADIRAERKRLDEREAELRGILLAPDAYRAGSEYIAHIITSQQRRLDRPLLEQRFGAEAVEQCCKPVAVTSIHLERRGGPPNFFVERRRRRKRRSDSHNDARDDELANLRAERRGRS